MYKRQIEYYFKLLNIARTYSLEDTLIRVAINLTSI